MGSASARLVLVVVLVSAIQSASADVMVASVRIIPGPDSPGEMDVEGPRIVGAAVAMRLPEPATASTTLPKAVVKYATEAGDDVAVTTTSTTVMEEPGPHGTLRDEGLLERILSFIGKLL